MGAIDIIKSQADAQHGSGEAQAELIPSVTSVGPHQSGESPVLSFNAKTLCVQVTITQAHCAKSLDPPADLVASARDKMLELVKSGQAVLFTIHHDRLEQAWTKLRSLELKDDSKESQRSITVRLATGAPKLPGLRISPPHTSDSMASLSISAVAKEVVGWRLDWLALHVARDLLLRGIKDQPNLTQIHGALVRARYGQVVEEIQLKCAQIFPPNDRQQSRLAINPARHEVSLVVFDLDAVSDVSLVETRLARIEQTIDKLPGSKANYVILKDELLESVETALSGPESLGIGLPLILLVAVDPITKIRISAAPKAKRNIQPHGDIPHLNFAIAADRLLATVDEFTPGASQDISRLSQAWLNGEMQRAGIVHGIRDGVLEEIRAQVAKNAEPKGILVAMGTPASAGKDPYLHTIITQDQYGTTEVSDTGGPQAQQRRALVKAGQLVGEVRYGTPPTTGKDVAGAELAPPPGEGLPNADIGEGIERRGSERFYAGCAGILEFDAAGALVLTKILVHEGDANFSSGDIAFDGPVEIKGNIESGANVKVKGDLIVRGEISGGRVECGGNITVDRGIVLGPYGSVRAKGDIKADFIENSTVTCYGSVSVVRSIMQSRVMTGGAIITTGPSSLIGGGTYICGNLLRTHNLGLPKGSKTEVSAGVNFRAEFSMRLRQKRLDMLILSCEEDRRAFKKIMETPAPKLSKLEKRAKDELRDRVSRWKSILDSARQHLYLVTATLNYDSAACLQILGKLSVNCQIRVGGNNIPIVGEVISVLVTANEQDGSFLQPLIAGKAKPAGKSARNGR